MKIRTSILIVALMTTGAFATQVFAQSEATPSATPMPSSKDFQKEKVQQESSQLSPEKAKMYNDAMQQAIDGNKDIRDQIRKAHDDADAILTAEKFDKAAFLAKAAELDQLYAKMRARSNDAFVSVVEKFSQDDRKILLKARNERRRHMSQPQ